MTRGSPSRIEYGFFRSGRTTIASVLLLGFALSGCETSSTTDSVMNSNRESSAPPPGTNQLPIADPVKLSSGGNPAQEVATNLSGVSQEQGDLSNRWDPPKISRQDFVIRVSLEAREQLLEQTKKPGNAYLLIGKVTPTTDDWQHISFVDFYEPERQYQFRTNGVKILVPRELVNRLHNATIDLDPDSKEYFVTLAR
jgi:hypothetical protein